MKTLILIRHAKSSWDHFGMKDIDRPLNERGHETAIKMSALLTTMIPEVDEILSSPAVRAFTTAQYFAKTYDIEKDVIVIHKKIYEAVPDDVIEIVNGLNDDAKTVVIFGHNPTFTYLANIFNNDFIDNVPTCGICIIESISDHWADFSIHNSTLKHFLRPSKMED